MARSATRYSIYPNPKAIEIVGSTSPALNQAVECWAAQLARATARNADEFTQNDRMFKDAMNQVPWGLNEWSLLATALKGVRVDPDFGNPSALLAAAVEDAHVLDHAGWKAYDHASGDASVIKPQDIEAEVRKLAEKLRQLTYDRAWAIIVVVQWFWEHHQEGIDMEKEAWWTLTFRREWSQKHSQKTKRRRVSFAKLQQEARRGK